MTTMEHIDEIVLQYGERSSSMPIDEIIELGDQLAGHLHFFTGEVDKAKKAWTAWMLRRERAEKLGWKIYIKQGITRAKEEAKAQAIADGITAEESTADDYYKHLRLKYDSANRVWEQMRTRVSFLKQEAKDR